MPLSNTTNETIAGQPYWDDFEKSKRFHRILVQTKRPVQVRELNQIQSMLQNQVEQLATSLYTEGRALVGGEQTYANNVTALQVVKDSTVNIANFYNANTGIGGIVRGGTSGAEGRVVQVAQQSSETYSAIIIAPMNDKSFAGDEQLSIVVGTTTYTMTAAPNAVVTRDAAVFSVRAGTYYLLGHAVDVPQQTVVVSSSTNQPRARIGFEMSEDFITSLDDSSLLDPALNSSNYAAPGADRLKLTATLATRTIDANNSTQVEQNASENFIEIARVGDLEVRNQATTEPITEDVLARRTFDESGSYVVRPFVLTAKDHNPPTNLPSGIGTLTGNANSTLIVNASPTNFSGALVSNSSFTPVNATAYTFYTGLQVGDVLVVNGEKRAITAVDGSYASQSLTVNNAFSVGFTNSTYGFISNDLMNLELSAGKAYVRGYEFETLGTTKLVVPRPRTTQNIDNGLISTYFGPFVGVKRGNGMFDLTTTQKVDLHCVDFSEIKQSATLYPYSRIGTGRVRSLVYSAGNGNANTLYNLYLTGMEFETKTYQVTAAANSDSSLTKITVTQSSKQVVLTHNTSSAGSSTWLLPQANNAFNGATVKFYGIYGETLYYDVVTSVFASTGNSATLTLTMDAAGLMDRINTSANVVVSFSDRALRSVTTANTLVIGATVAIESRTGLVSAGNTTMTGTDQNPMLFKIRENWISPSSIKDETFSTMYTWTGAAASSSNATHNTYSITAPTGATFYPVTTTLGHLSFVIANSSAVVPLNNMTTSISSPYTTASLTLPTSATGGGALSIIGRLEVTSNTALTAVRRTKTFVSGNTTSRTVNATGYLVSNTSVGQIAINDASAVRANASFKVIGLGVPDAVTLQKVYAVTNANAAITSTSEYVDVTSRYTLDTGQRNWCYDHAALVLKPGQIHHPTANQMLVVVDLFSHTGTSGYFTANSYNGVSYANIPTFTDPATGNTVELRDHVDFRPTRQANTVLANTAYMPYVGATQVFDTQNFYPHPEEYFQMDYAHYLGRVDKVVLTTDKQMKVVRGLPAVNPVPPADSEDTMTLYLVTYPPYTVNAELVQVETIEHRRYTMRDIGRLEKRIERLEYYVQLSQLEDSTLATPELDEDDIERFKNGILIDPFASYAIADVSDEDYQASMDTQQRELRPAFVSQGLRVGNWDSTQSTNVMRPSPVRNEVSTFILPTYTTTSFISQPLASKLVNVNPFAVASWNGRVTLNPSSDIWVDTVRAPQVSTNLFNAEDNWGTKSFGTVWNDWETTVVGQPRTDFTRVAAGTVAGPGSDGTGRARWFDVAIDSSVTRVTERHQRTGNTISATTSVRETNLGDRVIDTNIVPTIREANVVFVTTGLKPDSTLVASFDEVDVTNYIERASEVRLASNAAAATFIVGETITSNAASNAGQAVIAAITGNVLRVVNPRGRFFGSGENIHVTAALSSLRSTAHTAVPVSEYVSYAGRFQTSGSSNTTSVCLDTGASAVTNAYQNQVLYVTNGPGEGSRATITAYDGGTKVATLSSALSTTPTASSRYSIGNVKTDPLTTNLSGEMSYNAPSAGSRQPGCAYGMFFLPGYGYTTDTSSLRRLANGSIEGITLSSLRFNTGRRIFKIADNLSASVAKMSAETAYEAQGQTKVVENQKVSTVAVSISGQATTGTRADTTRITDAGTRVTVTPGAYIDPVAQTFLVDAQQNPSGVYITSLDLFFGRKDSGNVPVTVQLRTTVNGFPSADEVLGSAIAYSVNVVPSNTTPDPTNADHYTRFTFANPVYLAAGQEYAIVVLTNSFDYELMVGEIGQNIIGTTRRISEQPYAGSFFKSQNSRTWTPQQEEDLMFVLNRAVFSTSPATAVFKLAETPTLRPFGGGNLLTTDSNGTYFFDLYHVETQHIDFPETVNNATYQLKVTDAVTNTYQSTFSTRLDQNISLTSRARINNSNTDSLQLVVSFKTDSNLVAPMYDTSRFNLIAVRNVIDNGQLYSNGVIIENPGQMDATANAAYANTNTLTVSITGTMANGAECGTGGVATFYINSTGQVQNVYVTTNGSGYLETITVPAPTLATGAFSTTPVLTYRGETSNKVSIYGEQKARYVTRRVNLADGFEAADLKVYVSANRPPATNIDVYYKVLATGDKETFDQKNWVRMQVKSTQENVFSNTDREFREYEYRTTANTAAYTSNSVEYTRFRTFAIKIVMRSEDTTIVPRLRNLRAIALDV